MTLQGTHWDFSGRSAWHCSAAVASCSPTGAGRTAVPVPAAHALDGQLSSQSPRQATTLHLPQGLGKTKSKLNTTLLDWMETGGLFSLALQVWGADTCCRWISFISSPVPLALCLKCRLTSASSKPSPQEQPAPRLCTAIFPCFSFCPSALI